MTQIEIDVVLMSDTAVFSFPITTGIVAALLKI
jgi:hypothetical protein